MKFSVIVITALALAGIFACGRAEGKWDSEDLDVDFMDGYPSSSGMTEGEMVDYPFEPVEGMENTDFTLAPGTTLDTSDVAMTSTTLFKVVDGIATPLPTTSTYTSKHVTNIQSASASNKKDYSRLFTLCGVPITFIFVTMTVLIFFMCILVIYVVYSYPEYTRSFGNAPVYKYFFRRNQPRAEVPERNVESMLLAKHD